MKAMRAAYKNLSEASSHVWKICGNATENARAGGVAKNRENNEIKADVLAWCDEHLDEYGSDAKAAEHIFTKIAPIAFDTARDYIKQYRRGKGSARTP
jgi:hypothetical protein